MPRLVSWNVTRRCNLSCPHCYLDARSRTRGDGELSPAEALALIEAIASLAPGALLVLSGGEPLLRRDLPDLVRVARGCGLLPVVGTNGTLLTAGLASRLADCGAAAVGLSLDSRRPERHDAFRGAPGAWLRTVDAARAARRAGLAVQLQVTALSWNVVEIPALMELALELGVSSFNVFFLVCTGRGQELTDLGPAQYEETLHLLRVAEMKYRGRMLVRPRCAPHFRRVLAQTDASSPLLAAEAGRCLAGREYLRITPEGDVTPCPYLPLSCGSVRRHSLAAIWEGAPVLQRLRQPALAGRCGRCEYAALCGGCRARAYAARGDLMAEDPSCSHVPQGRRAWTAPHPDGAGPEWSPEAQAILDRVPPAFRRLVRQVVESAARREGLGLVTPALLARARAAYPPPGLDGDSGERGPEVAGHGIAP